MKSKEAIKEKIYDYRRELEITTNELVIFNLVNKINMLEWVLDEE